MVLGSGLNIGLQGAWMLAVGIWCHRAFPQLFPRSEGAAFGQLSRNACERTARLLQVPCAQGTRPPLGKVALVRGRVLDLSQSLPKLSAACDGHVGE